MTRRSDAVTGSSAAPDDRPDDARQKWLDRLDGLDDDWEELDSAEPWHGENDLTETPR
jgi:hypothetical protein